MNKISSHLRITSFLFVIMFMLTTSASGWNVPGTDHEGCCYSVKCAKEKPSADCEYQANIQENDFFKYYGGLDMKPYYYNQKWTRYSSYPHIYLIQNAIRIFQEEGNDNWAEYLGQDSNFQALADGAAWADAYKGRWYLIVTFKFFFIPIYQKPIDLTTYAGFDHYYSSFAGNPLGLGLENTDKAYASVPFVLGLLSTISEVVGVMFGAAGISCDFELYPRLEMSYPSAAFLSQEHFNNSISYSQSNNPTKYWENKSLEYNSLFEVGWAIHLAQDTTVIYHLHDIFESLPINPHNPFENDASGMGDPDLYNDYHIDGNQWRIGRDSDSMTVPQIIQSGALIVDNDHDWELAKSKGQTFVPESDQDDRREALKTGLTTSEQVTTEILAKYLKERKIPNRVPPLTGTVYQLDTKQEVEGPYYVFYRRIWAGSVEQDVGWWIDQDTPWEYVTKIDKGPFSVRMKDSERYEIRVEKPGYKYSGYIEYNNSQQMSLEINKKPIEWVQQPPGFADSDHTFSIYLRPDTGKPTSPQVTSSGLTISPSIIDPSSALSFKDISPETSGMVTNAMIQIRPEKITLTALNTAEKYPLHLPNETHIEIELANLVDLGTGETIQSPAQIPSAINSGIQKYDTFRRASVKKVFQKPICCNNKIDLIPIYNSSPSWTFIIPKSSSSGLIQYRDTDAQGVVSNIDTGYSHFAFQKVNNLAPKQMILKQNRITTSTDIPSSSYSYGSHNIFEGGPSLYSNHIARIPASNATLEISLTPSPGYIGPDFYDISDMNTGTTSSSSKTYMQSAQGQKINTASGVAYDKISALQYKGLVRSIRIKTNSEGLAKLKLETGTESGKIRLFIRVIDNPDAPGLHPAAVTEFIVQPPLTAMETGYPVTLLPSIGAVPLSRSLSEIYAVSDYGNDKTIFDMDLCIDRDNDEQGNSIITIAKCKSLPEAFMGFLTSIPKIISSKVNPQKVSISDTPIIPASITPIVPVSITQPPTASFTATPSSGTAPLKVNVDASDSKSGSSRITSYEWDFGDGMSGTGASGSHTYTSAGRYTIRLTVKDSAGQTDSTYQQIVVTSATKRDSGLKSPQAQFVVTPSSGIAPLKVKLDASGSQDPDGTIAGYIWDFGDGMTGTGVGESHTYTSAGTYTIRLTVHDNSGLTYSVSRQVIVSRSTTTVPTTLPTTIPPLSGTCQSGMTSCNNVCKNLQTDVVNCGACSNQCTTGMTCLGGNCVCTSGQTLCKNGCADTQTSNDNCGSCGKTCMYGQFCQSGKCICPIGKTLCSNSCVDILTDKNNCGSCNYACAAASFCSGGKCCSKVPAGGMPPTYKTFCE